MWHNHTSGQGNMAQKPGGGGRLKRFEKGWSKQERGRRGGEVIAQCTLWH